MGAAVAALSQSCCFPIDFAEVDDRALGLRHEVALVLHSRRLGVRLHGSLLLHPVELHARSNCLPASGRCYHGAGALNAAYAPAITDELSFLGRPPNPGD